MDCDRFRDAISARADGEAPGMSDAELDAHLASCVDCSAFSESTYALRRRLGLSDAAAVPNLTDTVVERVAEEDRRGVSTVMRWLLALVAVQIIVLAVPDFLAEGPAGHGLRHLGAFSLAYAFGLLVVVVRPARARTMLGVAVVLVVALALTAFIDIVRGQVPLIDETVHLLELFSAVFLWVLARPPALLDPDVQDDVDDAGPGLRVVRSDES